MPSNSLRSGILTLLMCSLGCSVSAYKRFYQSDLTGGSLEASGLLPHGGDPELVAMGGRLVAAGGSLH